MKEQKSSPGKFAQFFFILLFFILLIPPGMGQGKKIELRFVGNEDVECVSSTVCFELQMKAEFGQEFEFGSANVRMYFDSARLQFQSINCVFDPNAYTTSGPNIYPVYLDTVWGMESGHFLQYNILGTSIPGFGETISGNDFTTFAEICFVPQDSLENGESLYGSLVWDRLQNEAMGWSSQGIIFYELTAGGDLLPMDEQPSHHNWQYITDSTGYMADEIEVIWPCGEIPCVTMVENAEDLGTGSLRDAIGCAQSGDTIRFASALAGQTILLESSQILIGKSLTILNELAPGMIIESATTRLFEISPGNDVELRNLNMVSGSSGSPAAVLNRGSLILHDVSITRNPDLPVNVEQLILNNGQLQIQGYLEIKE